MHITFAYVSCLLFFQDVNTVCFEITFMCTLILGFYARYTDNDACKYYVEQDALVAEYSVGFGLLVCHANNALIIN